MIILDMDIPTDSTVTSTNRRKERFWIEFPAPWPTTLVTGTLECGYNGAWSFGSCAWVAGTAFEPAKIYIGGFVVNGAGSHKLMIRGLVNPANEDKHASVTIKY